MFIEEKIKDDEEDIAMKHEDKEEANSIAL